MFPITLNLPWYVTALVAIAIVAPPLALSAGVMLGAWLWHRALANRPPMPVIPIKRAKPKPEPAVEPPRVLPKVKT